MIFIINAQGTITAVSPSPVNQGSIGVNDIILVSPALAEGVTLNATLPNGIKIDPKGMAIVYPSVIEGYTEGYYIYRTTLDESVTQYPGLLSLRFSIKLKDGGTLTTSTAVIAIAGDMGIIEPPSIPSLDNNADIGNIIDTVNEIITKLNNINTNVASAVNAAISAGTDANNAYVYQNQAKAWATGETVYNNPVGVGEPQYNNNAKYYADKSEKAAEQSAISETQSAISAENTQSLLDSISISYDYETYKLTIEYTLPNGSVETKEYDFALEPSIINIDEVKRDGKYYLSLELANGTVKEIELDDIFRGFVKSNTDARGKVYGVDLNYKDTTFSTDKSSPPVNGLQYSGNIVVRDYRGNIVVPVKDLDSVPDYAAASAYQVEDALDQANQFTNKGLTHLGEQIGARFAETDHRIEQLESATLKYTEFSGVTDAVPVPVNAAKHVPVYKVGGMTYKCKNYFDKSKATGATETDTGFSFINTVNADNPNTIGVLKDLAPNLKVGDVVTFYANVVNPQKTNYANGYFYISGVAKNWYGGTFITITEEYLSGKLYAYGALNEVCEYNNVIITTEENAPYSPYFEGLRDTKVTELLSEGANLIPFPYSTTDKTMGGVTYTVQNDGGIKVSGIPTEYSEFQLLANDFKTASLPTKFTLSVQGNVTNIGYDASLQDNKGFAIAVLANTVGAGTDTAVDLSAYPNAHRLVFAIKRRYNNQVCSGIAYPMINYGTTTAPYKPYRGTLDTLPISAELRTFLSDKGYGRGVEGYPNYIDYERKVFVQNTYRKVFDGTENWGNNAIADGTSKRHTYALENAGVPTATNIIGAIISNHYASTTAGAIWNGNNGVALSTTGATIFLYDVAHNADTSAEWKAHLAELYASGNPLIAEYALAEPIEYDISAYITDDEIVVEGGGTITAVNEYNNPAFVEMLFTEKK